MATNFLLPDNPFYKDFILQAVSLIKVSRDSISKCLITVKHVIISFSQSNYSLLVRIDGMGV